MADKIGTAFVELTLDGSKFTAELKKADDQLKHTTTTTGGLGKALDDLKMKYFAVAAGITSAVYSAKKFVDMYMEQERAANRLAKAMANTGQYTRESFKRLVEYSEEIQRTTIYNDDAALSMMQLMQTFGMTEAQLKRSTEAAVNFASAMDVDLNTAALLLGKAYAGNTAALSRYGIVIQETKDKSEKFNNVLMQLEQRFGGSATAELDTYYGRWQNLKNIFGDLGELIGKGIIISFESLLWSVDKLEQGIVELISGALSPLEKMLGIITSLPYGVGEAFKSSYASLKIFRAELDAYAGMTSEEAAKQMKIIIGLQENVSQGQYKNQKAYAATTEEIIKQTEAMDEHIKMYEAELKAESAIFEKQLRADDERSALIEKYIGILQQGGTADIDTMIKNLDVYTNKELELLNEQADQQQKNAEQMEKDQREAMEKMSDNSEETFRNMASFYRDALMQMGDDTGSFLDMVKSKLKNLAASVASQVLTSVSMSVLRSIPGISSMASFAGLPINGTGGGGIPGLSNLGMLSSSPWAAGLTMGGSLIGGGYGAYKGIQSGNAFQAGLGGAGLGFGALSVSGALASGGIATGVANAAVATAALAPIAIAFLGIPAVIAAVAALAMKPGQDAERERQRRAAAYSRQLGSAATADISNMTLSQYAKGAGQLTGSKNVYAAVKYGGLSGGGIDELFKISDIVEGYVDNVEKFGESSLNAIGSFTQMTVEMDRFAGISRSWSGAARQTADAWLQVYENVKKLQVKAIVEDMDTGVGLFTANLKKLELLGLDAAELTKITFEKTLGFLTTDTLPALHGELTKARDKFKEAAAEMEKLARSEDEMAIKAAILNSNLALTEQQLETLRSGEVNTAMIDLYTALGIVDEELVLVRASTKEAQTQFENLEDVASSMKGTLDSLAAQFQGLDVSDDMRRLYTEAYKVAAGLELVAQAGQRLEQLPEVFGDMTDALAAGDVLAFADALMEASNSATFLGAALQQANMEKLAGLFLDLGTAGAVIYGIIQVTMVAVRGIEELTKVIYETPTGARWIDEFIQQLEKGGLIAKWFADQLKEALKPAEDISSTLEKALGTGKMTLGEAGSVYQKYVDEAKYSGMTDMQEQIARLNNEAMDATYALVEQYSTVFNQAAADGKITADEWKQIHETLTAVQAATDAIGKGVKEATLEIERQYEAQRYLARKAIMGPITDIIDTAGMSDYEKQVYAIRQQTNDWIVSLKDSGASLAELRQAEQAGAILIEQIAEAYEKANASFQKQFKSIIDKQGLGAVGSALYDLNSTYEDYILAAQEAGYATENLTEAYRIQAEAIINDFWKPVISGIKDTITSLTFSSFNRAVGVTRASTAASKYGELRASMLGATGEDFKTAYDAYSGFVNTYLTEMQNTYASSGAYLAAFDEVMSTLEAARNRADAEWQNMLSGYEKLTISKQETQILDFAAYKKRFDTYADKTERYLEQIAANTGGSVVAVIKDTPSSSGRNEPTKKGYTAPLTTITPWSV